MLPPLSVEMQSVQGEAMLREYQQRTIDQLYAWLEAGNQGNPCLVLPTGSGKSHIVAALCKDALQNWPETRVLMLTHVKELIEQNAEKMRQHWFHLMRFHIGTFRNAVDQLVSQREKK